MDSSELSQLFEQSLLVRSKSSPARTWSQKWKRDSWTQLLSGRTLKPSLGMDFLERWTSSLGDSPANHSVALESERETKIPDTSSPTFWTALEDADLPLFSLRMLKESSPQSSRKTTGGIQQEPLFCSMSLESWKGWVTKQRQGYSLRVKLAHLTRESGSSSWLTAQVQDSKHSGTNTSANGMRNLLVNQVNWPTVTATEARQGFQDRSRGMKGQQDPLTTIVVKESGLHAPDNRSTHGSRQGLWVTPTVGEEKNQNTSTQIYLQNQVGATLKNWVTPRTSGSSTRPNKTSPKQGLCLIEQVRGQAWATPKASDPQHAGPNMRDSAGNYALPAQVTKAWATPRTGATDNSRPNNKGGIPLGDQARREDPARSKNLNDQMGVMNGKLNPRWVETLMGLPIGWVMPSCSSPVTIELTNSDYSETESYRQPQK